MRNMKRSFPESDESIRYANSGSAIAVGGVVTLPNGFGIAKVAIAATTGTGAVAIRGEPELTKGTGYTLAQGQAWTWDGTKVVAWTPLSATLRGGVVTEAADTNAVTVNVRLEPIAGARIVAERHVVTAPEAAANSTNGRYDFVTGFGVAPSGISVMVRTTSTGVLKSGFVISEPAAGTIRVDGVAAGVQLDAADVIDIIAVYGA